MGDELRFGCIAALLIICGAMVLTNRRGWGWFLFIAFLMVPGIITNR